MGRTDFLGGNVDLLFKSLRKLCDTLPEETIVYSGHGYETTIAKEKMNLFGGYFDGY
jgi:glyoxylase-like metal-dependent hydrolase (beta-lactamase superfamily II)